jgi:RNA polymerase sigma factor (sigma-70 family)
MKYTDQEIITHIKKGKSDRVLKFLYQTVQVKISNWILNNNGSEEEAQDIFQDAVVAFYKYVLAGKYDESKSVQGFIFSIGRNLWINRAKQLNKQVSAPTDFAETEIEEDNILTQTMDAERSAKMEQLLNQLGERCKQLLTYSIFYSMPMQEISEIMGFSNANAAKTKNYKCKQRLMKIINDNQQVKEWLYR